MSLPPRWADRVERELASIARDGLRRVRHAADGGSRPHRRIAGRTYLSFASNDYLGLAADPRVASALAAAAREHGVGSGASHLLGGFTTVHAELEAVLASWVGQPRALLFSTGYQANLAIGAALVGAGDRVLQDRLNHASLIDAARIAGADLRRYLHADPASLEQRLERGGDGAALVMTDAVFSMDGTVAPLPALQAVARRHGALFMVDDAHGLGVLGPAGAGACAEAGVAPDLLVGTFGKALGTFGAFVAGAAPLVELLVQRARTYIYTTAPPPALAAATLAAVALARSEGWRRARLEELIARFRRGAADLGLELLPSATPIQPLLLGSAERALAVASRLREGGIWAPAVRPPTVPPGTARLRLTLTAGHAPADVDRLLAALAEAVPAEAATVALP